MIFGIQVISKLVDGGVEGSYIAVIMPYNYVNIIREAVAVLLEINTIDKEQNTFTLDILAK